MRKMKRVLFLGMMITMMLGLTGCGKSEREKKAEQLAEDWGMTTEQAEAVMDMFPMETETNSTNKSAEESDKEKEYQHYSAVDEWKDIVIEDLAVQIDDILYRPGTTTKEIMALVDSSAVDYTYDYNADRLLGTDILSNYDKITIYRDGMEWFVIHALNINNEATPLSEAMVTNVLPCDEAKKYCYFLMGISFEEMRGMSYTDVKAWVKEIFPEGSEIEEDSSGNNIRINVKQEFLLKKAEEMGLFVKKTAVFSFYIDKDTSNLADFDMGFPSTNYMEMMTPISLLSELSADEQAQLIQSAQDYVSQNYTCNNMTVVGNCFQVGEQQISFVFDSVLRFYNFCTVFEFVGEDGNKQYIDCELIKVYRNGKGEITFDDYYVGSPLSSVEEVIETHNLRNNISDTNLEIVNTETTTEE